MGAGSRRGISIRLGIAIAVTFALGIPPANAVVTDVKVRATRVYELGMVASEAGTAWFQNEARHPNRFDVYVQPTGGAAFKVNPPGTEGATGDLDGTTLAYQQYAKGSDIQFFDLVTHKRSSPPPMVNTKRWEYWPKYQAPWLLFARYNASLHTRSVILFNLKTKRSRLLDRVGENGYVDPGQINGNWAVWTHASGGRWRAYIYDIAHHRRTKVPNTSGLDSAPSVTANGTVYFDHSGKACGASARIMRYPRGGTPSVVLTFPHAVDTSRTYVFPLADGSIQVFHDRVDCGHLKFGGDLYRFVDDNGLTLTVNVMGTGTVTSDPAGIDCTSSCSHVFEPNTSVTLTASNGTFSGWDDPSCVTTDPCTLTLTTDTVVTATFT